jgi:hypothetical protein
MNELLTKVLDAHGGLERWRSYAKVEATIVSGGGFFALKGVLPDADPRRMAVWLHEERSSVTPYGAPDQRTMFTPDRITIEKLDGTTVAERLAPKDSFAGHQMHTPWDPLHLAYFNGEALWTYLATPFAFAMDGFRVEEIAPWQEGKETWRVLRVYFPGSIGTHCEVRRWLPRRATDAGIYRGQRHPLAEQASRLYARPRSASDLGYADGVDRRQRRRLLLDMSHHSKPAREDSRSSYGNDANHQWSRKILRRTA